MRILLTGAGGAISLGIIKSIKAVDKKIEFVGIDKNPYVKVEDLESFILSDKDVEDEGYLNYIIDIILNQNIDVLWPTINSELEIISKNKVYIERVCNCKVMINEYSNLIKAGDKGELYRILNKKFQEIIPKYYVVDTYNSLIDAIYKLGYPNKKVCIKKRIGAGSRGFRVIVEKYDKEKYLLDTQSKGIYIELEELNILKDKDDLNIIVMEYLDGIEYDVDVLSSKEKVLYTIPRKNLSMEYGTSIVTKSERNEVIEKYSKGIIEYLRLEYINSITYIFKNNKPYLLEINTRVPASIISTFNSGINYPYMALEILFDKIIKLDFEMEQNIITCKYQDDYYIK